MKAKLILKLPDNKVKLYKAYAKSQGMTLKKFLTYQVDVIISKIEVPK